MNSFTELTQSLQSLSGQVDPETLDMVLDQIDSAAGTLPDDGILQAFFKMMRAIAGYIRKNIRQDHQDALSVLLLIQKDFQTVLKGSFLPENTRQECYQNSKTRFFELKRRIAASSPSRQNLLSELKSAVLSLEWEINSETVRDFNLKINSLKTRWAKNKLVSSFLNILLALGKYIQQSRVNTHEEALVLVKSVYDHLDTIINTPEMTFADKKARLDTSIRKYHSLKEKARSAVQKTPSPSSVTIADIQPALSKFGSAAAEPDTGAELVTLSDEQLARQESDNKNQAARPRQSGPKPSVDVMEDLFNPKASPVDDLLDKIHLMNVLGKDDAPPSASREQDEQDTRQGIKKFTPTRVDRTPMDEITHRLDDFFDLDPETDKAGSTDAASFEPYQPPDDEDTAAISSELGAYESLRQSLDQAARDITPVSVDRIITEIARLKTLLSEKNEHPDVLPVLDSFAEFSRTVTHRLSRDH